MYAIDLDKIVAGDIILTRSSSRESQLIRQMTNCDYSHAILYVGVSSCIESDGLGVQAQNLLRLVFENIDDAVVLRLRNANLFHLIPGAIVFARQKIGMEYSTQEARLARIEQKIKAKEENRQFCTRFVAQAYQEAGITIVNNPDYCTPQQILESNDLRIIEDVLIEASEQQIALINDPNSPLEIQKKIHNYIFETARQVTSNDIQTFEQLSKYVLENPKREPEITKIIEDSGYLTMWKMDVERNPWNYDYAAFLKHYQDPRERKEMGYFWVTTENETRERFVMTLQALEFGYSFYRQKYFKIQIELYKKLIELSEQRQFVGLLALKN